MGPFVSMDISESGLTAYRLVMNVIASNIANMNSTVTPGGAPYQAEEAVLRPGPSFPSALASALGAPVGVEVAGIVAHAAPGTAVYQPGNPLANSQGMVVQPNVDLVQQMSDLIAASRAYDANVSAFRVEKTVEERALQLGQNI